VAASDAGKRRRTEMAENEIMTIEEVAEYLRVSERTVYEWAKKGEIPCGKIGTSWRFKRSEIQKWVDRRLGRSGISTLLPSASLSRVLDPRRCILLNITTKTEALNELIDVLATASQISNKEELTEAIFNREGLMSTGIGLGIGLPHVRLASVSDIVMAFGVSKKPITDYESLDGKPVYIIAMIAAGQNQHAEHIRLLAHISARLKDPETRQALIDASDSDEIYRTLTE
jgi:PTS system nitrogen regulatory IIA component